MNEVFELYVLTWLVHLFKYLVYEVLVVLVQLSLIHLGVSSSLVLEYFVY